MDTRLRFYQAWLQRIVFGPPYVEADHRALTPRGNAKGIRWMLMVVGLLWAALVVADWVARPWQRTPKSLSHFVGPEEPSEHPNLNRWVMPPQGDLARILGVSALDDPYEIVELKGERLERTNAEGYRTAAVERDQYPVVLCGDSFFAANNTVIDTLVGVLGVPSYNAAIDGKDVLSMAKYLEAAPPATRDSRVVVWTRIEAGLDAETFEAFDRYRAMYQQPLGTYESIKNHLFWPENLERYLIGSSWVRTNVNRIPAEARWTVLHRFTPDILLGRTDLPASQAPMLFRLMDMGVRPVYPDSLENERVAVQIARVAELLRRRNTTLVFTVAPDKSTIYRERLPANVHYRSGTIARLNRALVRRGVKVIDLETGLRRAALDRPDLLYYYTTDTHWSPRGQALAAHIIADSLKIWFPDLTPTSQ